MQNGGVLNLIDNIFSKFGGCLFCQVIGILMGTNCAPLLADFFLYSYESECLDNMIRGGHRKLARSFSLCYRYIDDLIFFNNKKFGDYVKEIYPSQLIVEKVKTSDDLANYLDLTFLQRATIDFTPSSMTNVIILISTLSIFHSFQAISHLSLHMLFIFPSW